MVFLKEVPLKMVTYDKKRILDYIKEKRTVAPTDLSVFGYDYQTSLYILIQLSIEGFVEDHGKKMVRPAAYFKTESGERKGVAGGRRQDAFRLTNKGLKEKLPDGARDVFYISTLYSTRSVE